MFCTRVAWVCLLLCKEEGSPPVSLQLLRGGTWALYDARLSVSLLGFGMRIIIIW